MKNKEMTNEGKQGLPMPAPGETHSRWKMLSSRMFPEQQWGWDPWAGEQAGEAGVGGPAAQRSPLPCL